MANASAPPKLGSEHFLMRRVANHLHIFGSVSEVGWGGLCSMVLSTFRCYFTFFRFDFSNSPFRSRLSGMMDWRYRSTFDLFSLYLLAIRAVVER